MATLGALAVALSSETAEAAATARLVYSRAHGAESCADEEALRRAVASRIGYDPFFPWATKTIVAGMAPTAPAGFVASVNLVDEHGMEHGTRALRTEGSCSELLDAAALAIAIAIDPLSLAAAKPAAAEPPRGEVAAPSAAPVYPSTTFATERIAVGERAVSPPGLVVQGGAGAVASTGVAPLPAVGFTAGVAVRRRGLSVAIEGRIDAPASAAAPGGGRASSWLAEAALLPCAHAGPVFVCAVGQLGSMQVASKGVSNGGYDSVRWLAVGGRFGAQLPLGGEMGLRVWSDVVGDLEPTTLQLNHAMVWQAPEVASSLGADVVVQF